MKKNKFLLPLLIVSTLVACNSNATYSNLKAEVSGHFTPEQATYLNSDKYDDTTPYNGNMSVSKPLPVSISWDCNKKSSFIVDLYKDSSLTDCVISYSTEENHFDFYNPIIGQEYFVKVTTQNSNSSESFSFKETLEVPGPRSLFVDGVENIRDIGGWGKYSGNTYVNYIKQGMIYRSGRFNEDKSSEVTVTISEDGLYEINNHLKIKTEIDLRRTSTNEVGSLSDKSPLGDSVNYVQLPMLYGGNNILTFTGKTSGDDYEYDNPAMIKKFFEILSDEKNYPIDFHCSIGKDRTGCLAYLLEGLLGFDQETMYRDYMFTNFANAGMCKLTDITDRYGKTLEEYENGSNINEKIFNYLNEVVGVSKDNLNSVISILKA